MSCPEFHQMVTGCQNSPPPRENSPNDVNVIIKDLVISQMRRFTIHYEAVVGKNYSNFCGRVIFEYSSNRHSPTHTGLMATKQTNKTASSATRIVTI